MPQPQIVWVTQYPAQPDQKIKRTVSGRLFDLITGKKTNTTLGRPISVFAINPDTFWILDQKNGTLFQVEKNLGEMPHLRRNRQVYFSMVGLTGFLNGKLIFTDSFYQGVYVYNPKKPEIKTLNQSLILDRPTGVAFSKSTHEIWVAETRSHRLVILDENGQIKRTVGKRGTGPSEFNFPTSIWIDKNGEIYVVDAMNFRVQIFSGDGEFISVFGEPGDATGYFSRPKGIAVDSYGNIYVADALFNAVQVFNRSGDFLYSFGKMGRGNGEFWMPSGIFIDEQDYIYVADSYNSRVQIFQLRNGGAR